MGSPILRGARVGGVDVVGRGAVVAEDLAGSLVGTDGVKADLSVGSGPDTAADLNLGSGLSPASGLEIETRDVGGHRVAKLPGGFFVMGSVMGSARFKDGPPHGVNLSPFEMFVTDVSEEQYRRFMTTGGNREALPDHPATKVDYDEATTYLRAVGEMTGEIVLLPTEAQDEYATRGAPVEIHIAMEQDPRFGVYRPGDVADFVRGRYENFVTALEMGTRIFTDPTAEAFRELTEGRIPFYGWRVHGTATGESPTPEEAWFDRPGPTDVNWGPENEWGLKQMMGNVLRWTRDWYSESTYLFTGDNPEGPIDGQSRAVRGFSWVNVIPSLFRAAFRDGDHPDGWGVDLGFRGVVAPQDSRR